MTDIAAADTKAMVAYTDDGQTLPITTLMDAGGNDIADPIHAVMKAVAGPCAAGLWYGFVIAAERVH
jgi:hypothetical protein